MVQGILSRLDLILIFCYFLVLIAIGIYYSRKQTEEDYLIAERKLGAFSTMMTMNASKTGAILMTFVALVFLWGFSAMLYFVGMIVGLLIFIPFALKLRANSQKYYTLADYFKHNYGKKVAYVASLMTILLMFGWLVINLIAGSKIFVFFTGWPFWLCAIIMVGIVLLYLVLSGYKAVIKTDILQYAAIVFIIAVLALMLFNGSLIPASEWNIFRADIATMLGFFIVGILSPFAAPDLWQRIYSSKNRKSLKLGLSWSIVFYALVAFLLGLVALTMKLTFPNINPDLALIYGFSNLLPSGLLGLSVVLLFGAIMSSTDTYLFTASSAIVQDFFNVGKKLVVKYIKRVMFIFALMALIIAISIQDMVIGTYIFVAFVMILAVPVVSTWINKKITQRTLLFGFGTGLIVSIIYVISNLIEGTLQPTMVIVALGSSILGIILGGIISLIKKK